MRITYDPEADAAYICFKRGRGEVTTVQLSEDIAVDLGLNEEVRGIEILSASAYFKSHKGSIPKVELENLEVA